MDHRILIVEDELIVAYDITQTLKEEGYSNTQIAKDFDSAMELISSFKPQLILTDIMLDQDPDGIKLGKHIHEVVKVPFIYITSHGSIEMIREASKTRPNTYLVKPFKVPDLVAAVELALVNVDHEGNTIWIKDGSNLLPFNTSEIAFLKAEENYTAINLINSKPALVRHPLSGVLNMLPEQNFIRTHKSFVVNANLVESFNYNSVTINGVSIPIGRTYRNDLQKAMEIAQVRKEA